MWDQIPHVLKEYIYSFDSTSKDIHRRKYESVLNAIIIRIMLQNVQRESGGTIRTKKYAHFRVY